MTYKLVYQFTPGEFAQLARLQSQVIQAIGLYMGAKGVEFNPQQHAVNWADGTVTTTTQVQEVQEEVEDAAK